MQKRTLVISLLFLVIITSIIVATTTCLVLYWFFNNTTLSVEDMYSRALIKIEQSLPIQTQLNSNLAVDIDQDFTINFALDDYIDIVLPAGESLDIAFASDIPLDFDVVVNDSLPFRTELPVDTEFEVTIFGVDKKVQVKGVVPIDINVPIALTIPVERSIPISYSGPIEIVSPAAMQVPAKAMLSSKIPVKSKLDVPVKLDIESDIEFLSAGVEAEILMPKLDIPFKRLDVEPNREALMQAAENFKGDLDPVFLQKHLERVHQGRAAGVSQTTSLYDAAKESLTQNVEQLKTRASDALSRKVHTTTLTVTDTLSVTVTEVPAASQSASSTGTTATTP